MSNPFSSSPAVAIIGAGPAGLIAAERLAASGCAVTVYDRMPSPGRKWLMAGRGGLNLTHSEPLKAFLGRYGAAESALRPFIEAFSPAMLVAWAENLGQPTFVGSSGRIFPKALKASPLLRALLARLTDLNVTFAMRRDWQGWTEIGALRFVSPEGEETIRPDAVMLALGGASWPRLGSNGAWTAWLGGRGVAIQPFEPANVGFRADWSQTFRDRFAGGPLKAIALNFEGRSVRGEAVVTRYGLEGGAIYALSGPLRDAIAKDGSALVEIDLRPAMTEAEIATRLARQNPSQSLANRLRKALHLAPVAANLLREAGPPPRETEALARRIKAVPIRLNAAEGIERAISSAGGIPFAELDEHLMIRSLPGVFAAGEMLDWEAPTGGYLLQASFSTGIAAAEGMLAYLGLPSQVRIPDGPEPAPEPNSPEQGA
ncbi:aminoacetone oxidase family FAD-binding enzyme [Kaistia algarum]|uniref:NAD(P)/FAD-dependent oxidoreductase n=1 Tax=Kaistia algarum TaxID=2083279 RepID=UPI000CE76C33|nr:TIGR03862 family flavoprotein [Kaistia algarum]MCX5515681.1 TIGR03862 family flavoprotein [Kaistia algarum]PPE80937.1 aminoacetone oxidase family FAD-binding enzyme [Kaistia algarum]